MLLWISAAILLAIYLLWIASRPQGVFWTVDEGGKFIYLQQYLETKNPALPLDYPGRTLDPDGEFYPSFYAIHRDGQIYMWWHVGFPILSAFFYKWFGWMGLYILPAAAGALTALLVGVIICLFVPRNQYLALLAFWITGLCTPVAFYSTMFWEHTLTAGLFTSGLYALLRGLRDGKPAWYVLAGCLAAMAVFFRVEVVAIFIGFGILLLLRNRKAAIFFGSAFTLLVAVLAVWHWSITGSPFTPILDALTSREPFVVLTTLGKRFIVHVLYNAPAVWTLELSRPMIISGTLSVLLMIPGVFIRQLRWVSWLGMLGALALTVWILTSPIGYRSVHGLLTAGPVIMFSIWAYSRLRVAPEVFGNKDDALFRIFRDLTLASTIVFFGVYIYKSWVGSGGLQWGPRYLLPFYPLLVTLGLLGLARCWQDFSKMFRLAIATLYFCAAIVGLGFQLRGAASVRNIQEYYQKSEVVLQSLNDRPLVTAWCDIVYLMPKLYRNQPIFSVTRTSLERWAEYAAQSRIENFYVAEIDLCSPDMLDVIKIKRQANPTGVNVIRFRTEDFPQHE